jgi:hypothetical protein
MIKKRFLIIFSVLIVIGLVLSAYQYVETMKADIVSAAQTIPNPGHSWSSMESGPASIQVNGQTITNLAIPVNLTDATNKAYVDAASSSYVPAFSTMCYMAYSTSAGVTCADGFTTLANYTNTTRTWTYGNILGSSNNVGSLITIGGDKVSFELTWCHYSHANPTDCWGSRGTNWAIGDCKPAIGRDGLFFGAYFGDVLQHPSSSAALCCK